MQNEKCQISNFLKMQLRPIVFQVKGTWWFIYELEKKEKNKEAELQEVRKRKSL